MRRKRKNTLTLNCLIRIFNRKIVKKRSKRITPGYSFKKMYIFFLLQRCAVGCCVVNNCVVRLETETNMTDVRNDEVN